MSREWSKELHDKAAKLWADPKLSTGDINKLLGMTGNALCGYAYRHREDFPKRARPVKAKPKANGCLRHENPAEIAKVRALIEQGLGVYKIADRLTMSRATLYKMKRFSPKTFETPERHRPKLKNPFRATQGAIARRGEGLHLKNGKGFLHLSGMTLTKERAYYWRGTARQAQNMKSQSIHSLVVVPERGN